jgi:hypothetical protein
MHYLITRDNYAIGKDLHLFTPKELELCDQEEKRWKESEPKDYTYIGPTTKYSKHGMLVKAAPQDPTLFQLLEIFPESKPYVIRKLKKDTKDKNSQRIRLEEQKLETKGKRFTAPDDQKWIYLHIIENIDHNIAELDWLIKKNTFTVNALERQEQTTTHNDKITEQDIARAKEVPISNFLKVNRMGFASCPFHKDLHPSLKVYKNNRWYCFSCNSGTDAINFIQKQHNLTFLEAVKFLLNK